ncbi:putative protease (CAAX family); putative membrane protein (fragment) [Bradyrhizobium sp. STM 3809]
MLDQTYWELLARLGAVPCGLGVIWLAVRLARRRFSEYLALCWPTRDEIILALLVMFIVDYSIGSLWSSLGMKTDAGVIADFHRLQRNGPLLLFLFMVWGCIGAPLVEEFAVRGFMMRGWSESFLGPAGAIVLSSAFWALCHTQYDWPGVFDIFLVGLMLGFFRHRSGSTWLTVIMHSAGNVNIFFLLMATN